MSRPRPMFTAIGCGHKGRDMIHSTKTAVKPRVGQPCSLGRGHVDDATLVLTFHYQELVQNGTWQVEPQQQVLVEGVHFGLDAPAGTITLLDHPFWQTQGRWRAADRVEALLYKGQVKHPQRIAAGFDYYASAQVTVLADKAQIIGDGVDALTLTATCEDITVIAIPLAVYNGDGEKVGIITVTGGSKAVRSTWKGSYRVTADPDELDPTWNLPVFGAALEDGVAEVEVV